MADDKEFWKGFKEGLQNDDSSNVQQGMSANPSHLVEKYRWQISPNEFLWKILLLFITLFGGMVSGAYTLFQEENQFKFSIGYALPSLIATVFGGLLGGGIFWGISALLFGPNTRGAARMLVLASACVIALYLYLSQFTLFNDWRGAFPRQSSLAIGAIALGFFWSLPWTRGPR